MFHRIIENSEKYDSMHYNRIFYALICMNNRIFSCIICMLLAVHLDPRS